LGRKTLSKGVETVANRRASEPDPKPTRRRPATTPEARENQLISLAVDLTEKQLLAGTASAQVISHYLKLGSSREKLEQERLMKENELLAAKAEAMASQKRIEELYSQAIAAMRAYGGHEPIESENYED
jgi:hypothetical protein